MTSVAAALGEEGRENALGLPRLSQAVLLVVDGLGHQQLLRAGSAAPVLAAAAAEQSPIDAAFPTTTPAGLAALTLGLSPGMHGFVGATFELPDFQRVLNPLRWEADPPPVAVQPEPTLFSRLRRVHTRSHGPVAYASSGMTRTLLAGAEACGYDTFDARSVSPRDGVLDYVYLPQLDKIGHTDGPNTANWNRCLAEIERLVHQLRRQIPESAAVIVTSDHGMVSVPDHRRIDVDGPEFSGGVRLLAGEPRMRHLYTADPIAVQQRWRSLLEDRATVLLRQEALEVGLYGELDEMLTERIGDVLAIAHDDWAMVSPTVDPRVSGLRGLHGALTEEELLVPAVLLRGVAGTAA